MTEGNLTPQQKVRSGNWSTAFAAWVELHSPAYVPPERKYPQNGFRTVRTTRTPTATPAGPQHTPTGNYGG